MKISLYMLSGIFDIACIIHLKYSKQRCLKKVHNIMDYFSNFHKFQIFS